MINEQCACHGCDKPIFYEDDGFTRSLCFSCTSMRCDLPEHGHI